MMFYFWQKDLKGHLHDNDEVIKGMADNCEGEVFLLFICLLNGNSLTMCAKTTTGHFFLYSSIYEI